MAKSENPTPKEPATFDLTLDEFCERLSESDRRVELIGAFHFSERQAGRLKDAESAYRARYQAFMKKPV
jgi:hypothetical protein